MREMILGQDSTFTIDSFISRYNSDLANDLGNLVGRVSTLVNKFFDNKIPENSGLMPEDKKLIEKANNINFKVYEKISNNKINDALELIILLINSINKYMEISKPWIHVKNNKSKAASILYTALESIRISLNLLEPLMPTKINNIYEMLGLTDNSAKKKLLYLELYLVILKFLFLKLSKRKII